MLYEAHKFGGSSKCTQDSSMLPYARSSHGAYRSPHALRALRSLAQQSLSQMQPRRCMQTALDSGDMHLGVFATRAQRVQHPSITTPAAAARQTRSLMSLLIDPHRAPTPPARATRQRPQRDASVPVAAQRNGAGGASTATRDTAACAGVHVPVKQDVRSCGNLSVGDTGQEEIVAVMDALLAGQAEQSGSMKEHDGKRGTSGSLEPQPAAAVAITQLQHAARTGENGNDVRRDSLETGALADYVQASQHTKICTAACSTEAADEPIALRFVRCASDASAARMVHVHGHPMHSWRARTIERA